MECFVGVDDGYFERSWRRTVLAAALHCTTADGIVPCSLSATWITVDGADATYAIMEAVRRLQPPYGCRRLVLLADTPIYAGFNVADLEYVSEELGIPVISVYHYEPDREAIRAALAKHFPGEDWRVRVLEKDWRRIRRVDCSRGVLYASTYYIGFLEAASILCRLQVYTRSPEPLYTAGVFASAVSRSLLGKP